MIKGLFFSRDPGGTNAIIPVAKQIGHGKAIQAVNFASSFAIPIWEQSGLEFTPLPDTLSLQEIDFLLKSTKPDFVFTGTSDDTTLEGNFWRSAKKLNIITYSIIDHWTRYRERYIVDGVFMPTDFIFTIDQDSKNEMISLGFKEKTVLISGQPHFEKFYGYKPLYSKRQFCETNQLLQKKIILFVSDNISSSFPSNVPHQPTLGFDEHTILQALLYELDLISEFRDEFQLVIKLHPKEPDDNFSELERSKKIKLPYRIIKGGDNMELLYHSDFVIGMFSMLLFEAYLMNKQVLSLQLNAIRVTNFGQVKIPIVLEPVALQNILKSFLTQGNSLQPLPYAASVEKIIKTLKAGV
jgi:hypothetical protein